MAWLILFVAGLLEIGWAVGLKYTHGFTRAWPTIGTAVALAGSMGLLGLALRTLPLGTAYAVWTGIGTVGTAVLGIILFREPATVVRLVCIGLILTGIIGLRFVGTTTEPRTASSVAETARGMNADGVGDAVAERDGGNDQSGASGSR